MEPIVNTAATPPAAPRPPETAGAHAARRGSREALGQAHETAPARPEAAALATLPERARPAAAAHAPVASAAAAAALVAQVCTQLLRHPDQALLAQAAPGADTALRLLDG